MWKNKPSRASERAACKINLLYSVMAKIHQVSLLTSAINTYFVLLADYQAQINLVCIF